MLHKKSREKPATQLENVFYNLQGGSPAMDYRPIKGGVEILLVAGSHADSTLNIFNIFMPKCPFCKTTGKRVTLQTSNIFHVSKAGPRKKIIAADKH